MDHLKFLKLNFNVGLVVASPLNTTMLVVRHGGPFPVVSTMRSST